MASYFNLTLDTTAPTGCSLRINNGAAKTGQTGVTLSIACSDTVKTGYTMKVYGDIKVGSNTAPLTKDQAAWENFVASKSVTLLSGDGSKTVKVTIRDDVYNEAAEVTAAITLDTQLPTVTITGPDVAKLSAQAGKDASVFSFKADEAFSQYKVKVVPTAASAQDSGVQIPTAAGSVNMSGTGNFTANTNVEATIKGTDFKTAMGGSDGVGIVKVFVFDGVNWSA